mmetsp:Transcript_77251/g.151303  ORF Transcript_77251/g.151303 Transcript_77251/m.151303 type:complete len:182 (-) Transcript_77251:88-633(-)
MSYSRLVFALIASIVPAMVAAGNFKKSHNGGKHGPNCPDVSHFFAECGASSYNRIEVANLKYSSSDSSATLEVIHSGECTAILHYQRTYLDDGFVVPAGTVRDTYMACIVSYHLPLVPEAWEMKCSSYSNSATAYNPVSLQIRNEEGNGVVQAGATYSRATSAGGVGSNEVSWFNSHCALK